MTTCYVSTPDAKSRPRRSRAGSDPERVHAAVETGIDVPGRTLFFFGHVDDQIVARTVVALELLGQAEGPIRIVLSSGGGSVDAGMTLFDAIRMCPAPVVVDCYGAVQSMAVAILQAATIRRLSPECRVMLHGGSAAVEGLATAAIMDVAREITRSHDRYCEIIAERAKRPVGDIQEMCKSETYLDAHAAVKAGLADSVLRVYNPMRVEKVPQKKRKKR